MAGFFRMEREMEKRFISEVILDLDTLRDHAAHGGPMWKRLLPRLFCAAVCLWVAWSMFDSPEFLKYFCGAFLLALGVLWVRNKDGGEKYEKLLAENGGFPKRNLISITENGIHFWNPETQNAVDVAFSQIRSIYRTKMMLVLTLENGTTTAINHTNVTGGTPAELEAFLLARSGVKRIGRRWDNRMFRKGIIGALAVGFLWSFLGIYNYTPLPKSMTYHQAAQILEECGITPPSEDLLEELEEYGPNEYAIGDLLYYAGAGEYDCETWEWTPAESGVYTFDLEFFEVSMMCTNFLRGVSAMSGGELEFTDVIEDDAQVDWEAGTGTKTVTFLYNGAAQTLRAEVMSDWFDPAFANGLAQIVGTSEDGKRLYFYYDGYQMVSVFYCDADWARAFARATGCTLEKELL